MTDLTTGCTRTGPHPARDITEMEARAEGHYADRVSLVHSTLFTEDGSMLLDVWGPEDSSVKNWEANAAYAYLAWTSHEALVKAVEAALEYIDTVTTTAGFCRSSEYAEDYVKQLDAALSLASGKGA